LALLAVCFDTSERSFFVQAEEAAEAAAAEPAAAEPAAAEPAAAEAAAETEAAPAAEGEVAAAGEEVAGTEEEKGQKFVDSARELQEKLGQLKALLDAKGEGADPGLKEKLAGLEDQLKSLGLDSITGGGEVGSNKELTEFLGACVAMSMRKIGMQRPSTLSALRRLVDNNMSPQEASKNELWRMVGVCVGEFREDEFVNFKQGKIKILPKAYVDASKKPEAEQKVMEIDAQVWAELKKISEKLLKDLLGTAPAEKPPLKSAYVAMVFLFIMIAGMGKLFIDMQRRAGDEKEKKASKKDSKKAK